MSLARLPILVLSLPLLACPTVAVDDDDSGESAPAPPSTPTAIRPSCS